MDIMKQIEKQLKKNPNKYLQGNLDLECPECKTKQTVEFPTKSFVCNNCTKTVNVEFDIK